MTDRSTEHARAFWYPLADTRFSGAHACAPSVPSRLETLDSELSVLEETVLRARKLRNRQTVTCGLPVEVLSSIFEFVRDLWPPSRTTRRTKVRYDLGWISITHICSMWRDVALGTPNLWAKHDDVLNMPVEYIELVLSRAGSLPLDLSVDFRPSEESNKRHGSDGSDSDSVYGDNGDSSSSSSSSGGGSDGDGDGDGEDDDGDSENGSSSTSISELSVLTSTDDDDDFLDSPERQRARTWLCPSICLRTTRLCMRGLNQASTFLVLIPIAPHLEGLLKLHLDVHSPSPGVLPRHMADIPGLTELSLKGFFMPWSSPIFSSTLTYLELLVQFHHPPIRSLDAKPSLDQLRTALDSMQSLQTLILVNIVPTDLREEAEEAIVLPRNLRLFVFRFNHASMFNTSLRLLKRLRFLETCTRYATLCKESATGLDESQKELVRLCLRNLTSFGSRNLRELVVSEGCISASTSEHALRTPSYPAEMDYLDDNRPGERLTHSGPLMAHVDIGGLLLGSYLRSLDVAELQAATFTSQMCDKLGRSDRWAGVAAVAPCIRRLGVSFFHCLSLLHGLADKVEDEFKLFPLLRVLVFHGIENSQADEANITRQLNALANVISLRKASGTPMQEVVFSKNAEEWAVWADFRAEVTVTFM